MLKLVIISILGRYNKKTAQKNQQKSKFVSGAIY